MCYFVKFCFVHLISPAIRMHLLELFLLFAMYFDQLLEMFHGYRRVSTSLISMKEGCGFFVLLKICWFLFFFLNLVLAMEHKTFHKLSKPSTTDLYTQPSFCFILTHFDTVPIMCQGEPWTFNVPTSVFGTAGLQPAPLGCI